MLVIKVKYFKIKSANGVEEYYHGLCYYFKRSESGSISNNNIGEPYQIYFAAFEGVVDQLDQMKTFHATKQIVEAAKTLVEKWKYESVALQNQLEHGKRCQ